MKRALVLATVTALALARPEQYREKEDFQYSRSSSDEGTKSGFYDAQRGNMGGNYERAHNMDLLAQHQMGGLVRNVEGELGDGVKQKSGSVFSAANSRGVYGSGQYDLSNLQGRNFHEGTNFGDSQSHSSLSSQQAGYGSQSYRRSSAANSAYGSQSQTSAYNGYQTSQNADQALYASNVQSADNLQSISDYDRAHLASHGYNSQSGYQGQSALDQTASQHSSTAYGSNTGSQYRLVGASPVRVYVRPGRIVTIPVAAQSFDDTQNSASSFDQNSVNSEVESLSPDHGMKPTGKAKHYETSYSYSKQWEKHDTVTAVPLAIPTVNPYPSNSEFFEDTEAHGSEHHEASAQEARNLHSSSQYKGYNVKSASTKRPTASTSYVNQAGSSTYGHSASDVNHAGSSTYKQSLTNVNNARSGTYGQSEPDVNYSGYTYGRSASDINHAGSSTYGQKASDVNHAASSTYRQSATNVNHAASSTYGESASDVNHAGSSTYGQSASDASLFGNSGTNTHRTYTYGAADLNSANLNSQVENFSSKPKSYQSSYSYHKSWERQGDPYVIYPSTNSQYPSVDSQTSQKLLSSSNHGSSYGSQQYDRYRQGHGYAADSDCDENGHFRVARSYNLHERPSYQQTQNEGQEYLGQQSQNLEDFQMSQNLENFGQQSQKLEDLGQQSQNLEDFGQQSQNLEDLGQQSQNLEDFGQQSQKLEDLGQQPQNLEHFGQQSQKLEDLGQQSQNLEDFGQQSQNLEDLGQQSQNLEDFGQQSQKLEDLGQQSQNLEDFGQQTQDQWDQQSQTDAGQETQNIWDMFQLNSESSAQKPDSIFATSKPTGYQLFQTYDHPIPFEQANEHFSQSTTQDKDVMQAEDVNQQTQHYWQSFQSNLNQNGQNAYVPMTPYNPTLQPDWQKYLIDHNIHINTGYYQHNHEQSGFNGNSWMGNQQPYNYNSYANTGYNLNSWPLNPTYSQLYRPQTGYGHSYTNTQYHSPSESVNTYTQTYINHKNNSTYETINITESDSSLSNFWNFLDDIEKETLPETDTYNSANWEHKEKEVEQTNTNIDQRQQEQQNSYNIAHTKKEDEIIKTIEQTNNLNQNSFDKSTDHDIRKTETTTARIATTSVKQVHHEVERGDIAPEKQKPQEEPGRGDIGPENSSEEETENNPTKPLQVFETEITKHTPYKTPEEIETLSLTKDTIAQANTVVEQDKKLPKADNTQDVTLTVISLNDQKNEQPILDNKKLSSTTPKINYGYHQTEVQNEISKTTSTTPRINQDYGHSHFNIEHENQKNTEQQFENTGQIESINQQSYNQFEGFDQESQQNVEQQLSDFSQQVGDFGQQLSDFGQQPGDFGQQTGDFGAQPGDFGQQPDDFGQQLANFGQQTEQKEQELESYNLKQNVEQELSHSENSTKIGQQKEELETLGQQNESLNQESFNQFEDLGQQTQDLGQQHYQLSDNFGQQNEGFQQESLDNFEQHAQFEQQSLPSFDQQSENSDVAPKELDQETENLEQQSQNGALWQPDNQQHASEVEVFASPSPYNDEKEGRSPVEREPVVEPEIVAKKADTVDSPPESSTENPGFWGKLGSKFSNAKDKVKSWFSSS